MALRKNYLIAGQASLTGNGFQVPIGEQTHTLSDSYIKVESVNSTKNDALAHVSIKSGDIFIRKTYGFVPKLDDQNFIKQAYEHLKTLEEFFGSVDC